MLLPTSNFELSLICRFTDEVGNMQRLLKPIFQLHLRRSPLGSPNLPEAIATLFRVVFWVILPCKMIDNHFTRQYNPEDNSEHHTRRRENLKSHTIATLLTQQIYIIWHLSCRIFHSQDHVLWSRTVWLWPPASLC
jgi:hypothetical protein